MKENQANEIDNAFRDGLGNISETPSPKVWDGLRFSLIERRLIGVERQNYWLKTSTGLLSAAVVVLLGLLYEGTAVGFISRPQNDRIIFRDKLMHDTVYVSKTEKVYIPIKEIVYVNQNEKIDENVVVSESKLTDNDKNITINQKNNPSLVKENSNIEPNNSEILSNTNNNFVQPNIPKSEMKVHDEETLVLSLKKLQIKGFDSLNVYKQLPDIYYQNRFVYRHAVEKEKGVSFKNPSIKVFYAPESASVPMKTDGSLFAETIGTERNHNTYSFGVNLSFDLTNKWSIESGLTSSYTEFKTQNAVKKRPVITEMYDGSPNFVYRTALGTTVVPIDKLNTKPIMGNNVLVESEEKHVIRQLRIPLLAKYEFYEGRKMLGVYTNKFSLYQVFGTELRIIRSQMVNAEVYEPDGNDFYVSFTDFKEVKPYNWGFVFGTGFKYNLDQKLNFYFEPTIRFSTSSYSQSTIVKSYPRWWGFAFGFQYNLK
jgi:hypothetical protein